MIALVVAALGLIIMAGACKAAEARGGPVRPARAAVAVYEEGSPIAADGGSLSLTPPLQAPTPSPTAAPSPTPSPTPTASPPKDRPVEEALAKPTSSPPTEQLQRARAPVARLDVPILMYHHVGPLPPKPDAIRRGLTVSQEDFTTQMRLLAESGFHSVSLQDLVDAFAGRQLPPKPVIITFDDGYLDNYTHALPVLKQMGMTATFFVVTDLIGRNEYMTRSQVAEMAREGMSIQAHGVTHSDLTLLPPQQVAYQVNESRRVIERETGQRIFFYSYPAGKYNDMVQSVVRDAGYLAAVSTRYGSDHYAAEPFILKRVRVSGGESIQSFALKLGISQ